MWKRSFLTGVLLLAGGSLRIYVSSLERAFLFSTVNIFAIILTLIGAAMILSGFLRLVVSIFRHLFTSLTD